jgi:hypothetical protein
VLHRSKETRRTMPATVAIVHVDPDLWPDLWPTLPCSAADCARMPSAALRATHARTNPAARHGVPEHAPAALRQSVGSSNRLGTPSAGTA